MRAALAYKPEYDEVPVVSTEALESNVVAMRGELTELKTEFKEHRKEFAAAIARIDNDIRVAVSKLQDEIRAMAAKAEKDLKEFAAGIENRFTGIDKQFTGAENRFSGLDKQFSEMRSEQRSLRDRVDRNHDVLTAKIDATNATVSQLDRKVDRIGTRLTVLIWFVGVLGSSAIFIVTLGKALKWF